VNKLGANTWIWTSPLTDAWLAEFAPRIREWGFDVIELPIENLDDWDPERTRELLQQVGLEATTCLVMPPGRDLVPDDRQQIADTQWYLRGCLDVASVIGAGVVAGPAYSPVGRTWLMQPDERKQTVDRLVEALRPVVAHAEERGVAVVSVPDYCTEEVAEPLRNKPYQYRGSGARNRRTPGFAVLRSST